jgi:hypothetical protein
MAVECRPLPVREEPACGERTPNAMVKLGLIGRGTPTPKVVSTRTSVIRFDRRRDLDSGIEFEIVFGCPSSLTTCIVHTSPVQMFVEASTALPPFAVYRQCSVKQSALSAQTLQLRFERQMPDDARHDSSAHTGLRLMSILLHLAICFAFPAKLPLSQKNAIARLQRFFLLEKEAQFSNEMFILKHHAHLSV